MPTVEFGVHAPAHDFPGGASLRRRTLHRVMNELIDSWEEGAGVREFVVLTAQASEAPPGGPEHDPDRRGHACRSSTCSAWISAPLLERPGAPIQGGELDTSLMLFLAPELVRMELAQDFAVTPEMLGRYRPGHSRHLPQGSPGIHRVSQPRLRPKGGAAV